MAGAKVAFVCCLLQADDQGVLLETTVVSAALS